MPKAKPSGRSSGNVNLSFTLVNIPITLYSGTVSDHGIKRNEYVVTPEGDHPVGRGQIDKVTGELLEHGAEVVKKIQTEHGPVYVEDQEIEQLFQLSPDTLVVQRFEPEANFHAGHYVPKGLLYLEPRKSGSGAKKGPDPIAARLLATLLAAMKANNAIAVCELTTRGVPKPAVLMPDGRLWLTFHTDATREQRPMTDVPVVDAEVDMMGSIVTSMWSDEPMDFTDERSAAIQARADEKAAAGEFDKPAEVAVAAAPAPNVTDLMALLSASVEAAKAGTAA
jgi:non-homologous end joining protein Ku